jgi:hypothetical protein
LDVFLLFFLTLDLLGSACLGDAFTVLLAIKYDKI